MPKSRIRKREKKYVPEKVASALPEPKESPKWLAPIMIAAFLLGLAWIVAYYISPSHRFPIPSLGTWNMGVGFALVGIGFALATRWR
jgi:hypothetical protein